MARDKTASLSKTSRAMAIVGHSASGGHSKPPPSPVQVSALAKGNRLYRDHINFDDDPTGGDMPYEFHEYPKHVTVEGKLFVCNSEDEERIALETGSLVREEDERKRLVALAEVKGLKVDGRWGLDRMAKALADAGHDPAANPFA